ncbi:MAG: magnesium/cobalt transporter CorA [Spirochaetaceae bacterium]|jgi:magnesium transporter|nr:magnesium/cobalt transporter CorA [Spirochaetaceae bacterium]
MELSIISYNSESSDTNIADSVEKLMAYRKPDRVNWLNVVGLEDTEAINKIAEEYHIHPLSVEDIMNTGQRPKVEEFEDYTLIIVRSIREVSTGSTSADVSSSSDGGKVVFEQMSLVLAGNTLISFQEFPGDSFNHIRTRIVDNSGRVRHSGADYLCYLLWDAIVDEYFTVLDEEGNAIETLEDRAMQENDRNFLEDIQNAKRRLLKLRRAIWPLRESISIILKDDGTRLSAGLNPFFKDLQENIVQAIETVETYRELLNSTVELNNTVISNRTNQVMKVLTIISTLFIPLTFIVGVYGMNFVYMPELHLRWAYPLCWAVMLMVAGGMLLFFRRRKWF